MNYQLLYKEFEKSQCKLLTSQEEMNDLTKTKQFQHVMVKILASCGHEHQCVVTNFLVRRTADICTECRKNKIKIQQTLKNKETTGYCFQIENDSFLIVKNKLESFYEVHKTNEGCKADIIIRPLNSISDNWVAIQLKATTQQSFGMYSFKNIHKNYDDHIIICVCIKENKLWIIPFDAVKHLKNGLNISIKSKYNKYLVDDSNSLENHISNLSKSIKLFTKEEAFTPISIFQQQEQNYANIRIKNIPFLKFVKPDIENSKVDFYVNNLKVQEKISSLSRGKSHIITISVNNGKNENKCRNFRTYRKGENDIYWFNLKESSIFYVLPEHVLYDRKFISDKGETLNKISLVINTHKNWLENFKYDYMNIDMNKLKKQFNC